VSAGAVRRAAIIAVGSELLTPMRLDTNSLFITETLNGIGIDVLFKSVVGDDRDELASHLAFALPRVDLLITSGGLGPTDDDVTRDVVAAHLGRALSEDERITETIRQRFAARGGQMPENNRRQAMVPQGAVVLPNPNGSAPGLWIEHGEKSILLVPGPPREMRPMLVRVVDERLRARTGGAILLRRVLGIVGRSESRVDEIAQPIYSRWRAQEPAIETTILAASGIIELHLSARGADVAALTTALDGAVAEIRTAMPDDVFSADGTSLEGVVGSLLVERAWQVALAESCTGGLVTSRLTDVPGASAYVNRTVVAYSNQAKTDLLGVSVELLTAHGAVSEPVAQAMAEGIRERAGVEVGIGITGIAGPTGGTPTKPVGTVCISVAVPDETVVRTFAFPGNRELVKMFAAVNALDMTRRLLARARLSR
jgi:nicotinamide-nucleotide amidase